MDTRIRNVIDKFYVTQNDESMKIKFKRDHMRNCFVTRTTTVEDDFGILCRTEIYERRPG